MTWGTLARTGTITPTPGNLGGAARTTWETTPTCTNYCTAEVGGQRDVPGRHLLAVLDRDHGRRGLRRLPQGAADLVRPLDVPTATTKSCGDCHAGYTCTTGNLAACTVNKTAHLNGTFDAATLSCNSCHGSATNNAPPTATNGTATGVKVGAHQKHVTGTTLRSASLACDACHTVPATTSHSNATVNMTWNTLATNNGGLTPTRPTWGRDHADPRHLGGDAELHQLLPRPEVDRERHLRRQPDHAAVDRHRAVAAACGSCHKAPPSSGRTPA